MPFDLTRLETVGPAVPALEGVAAIPATGGAQLAVSSEGTLVYVPGTAASAERPIDWLTRDGKTAVLRAANAVWANPRFSPDGEKLALDISDGKQRDIWVYDWARDTLTQLTFDPGQDRISGLDARRPAHRVCVRSRQGRHLQSVLGERRRHGRGHAADRQPGTTSGPSRGIRAAGSSPSRPARAATGVDLMILPMEGDATRGWTPGTPTVISEHAGQRSDADVLAGRPLDRVRLE